MITIDWTNKVVNSTASITDIIAFKNEIREYEDDAIGILYAPIITFKQIDVGGGAYFYAIDFINGYQLKFPNAGNYSIIGNINATIIPVAGVYVERTKALAFASVSGSGGSSLTAQQVREEMDNNSIKLKEIHRINKLDPNNPVITDNSTITSGDIVIDLAGDGVNISIATRQ